MSWSYSCRGKAEGPAYAKTREKMEFSSGEAGEAGLTARGGSTLLYGVLRRLPGRGGI